MPLTDRVAEADAYLKARSGTYEQRCQRYDAALEVMHAHGLDDDSTIVDVGSGWGELGVRLHTGREGRYVGTIPHWDNGFPPSRARYIPVDAAVDGTDLNHWTPHRRAEWFVCLEVLEHLKWWGLLLDRLRHTADRGIIVSTPNPDVVDVLAMDPTHHQAIFAQQLRGKGFRVDTRSFYGQSDDALFAVWTPPPPPAWEKLKPERTENCACGSYCTDGVCTAEELGEPVEPTRAEKCARSLIINRSETVCGACRKGASPYAETHADIVDYKPVKGGGCGVRWEYLTSDYSGQTMKDAAVSMRPDLEWFEQWPKHSGR